MNGQNQDGRRVPVNSETTRPGRWRLAANASAPRTLLLVVGGSLMVAAVLAAVPRDVPGVALAVVMGAAWLSFAIALTLPTRAERAAVELTQRLGQFRHELNALGDAPSHAGLIQLLAYAQALELKDDEIRDELEQIDTALDALTLREQLARGESPIVASPYSFAGDDQCHFTGPARFGRRSSDQVGHLVFTSDWLRFRGTIDVSIAWSEVVGVERAGRDLFVSLLDTTRTLRFSCESTRDAARSGVMAEYLAQRAVEDNNAPEPRAYGAMV